MEESSSSSLTVDPSTSRRGRERYFPHATDEQWNDWRWQFRNRVTSLEELLKYLPIPESEWASRREILRDFRIDKYKGWNTKGLVTAGGLRKDAFYLYQSFLRPELPVVHITSKTYFLRRGDPENGIRAYSNLPRLELFLNGERVQRRAVLAAGDRVRIGTPGVELELVRIEG